MDFDFTKQPGCMLLNRDIVTDGKPLVSVITPFYNAGKYFEQTFNSVLNQTFPFFEWIIVNDGSTNKADVDLLEGFANRDSRICVLHKKNGGISTARNMAIKAAMTDIIIPLDADDLIEQTYVEEVYWALYFNKEASWCYSNSVGFQNQEYVWNRRFNAALLRSSNFLSCTSAIRKADLLEVGLYDESEKHYNEDWHLWLRFLSEHKKPVKIGSYGFWYRRLDSGVLNTVRKNPKIRKTAQKMIAEAARNLDTTVTAIEYPRVEKISQFGTPRISAWDKSFYKSHNKLRVLMLLPWMVMGGADKLNLDIVKKINKDKFDVGIITTFTFENKWKQRFSHYTPEVFCLPDFLDMNSWPEFISYYIKSREIDIVFIDVSEYAYYLLPWLRIHFPMLPIVDYVHMSEWNVKNGGYARTSCQMSVFLDKTFVCNELTRNEMINIYGRSPEEIETLYIGTDIEVFNPDKVEQGYVYKILQLEPSRPLILFPCRVHAQKRPFLMLEIASGLKKYIDNVAFVVVGDGPQLNELKIRVKQMKLQNTVFLVEKQNKMMPFYKDSAVTLICSIKEGLALTAYESLSMGVPVVSADVGGQSELIDESVGYLIPLMQNEATDYDSRNYQKEEIDAYVDALREILSDSQRRHAMGTAGRKRIENQFSTDDMVKKLESLFYDLTQNQRFCKRRMETFEALTRLKGSGESINMLYSEIQLRDIAGSVVNETSIKNELARIANSRFGSKLIKIALKLKLNKLFR